MLTQLRQTLRKLLAAEPERRDIVRLGRQLERLEDRTMLSASHGAMPHGNGNAYGNQGLHKGNGPRSSEQPAYISSPHQSFEPQQVGLESRSFSPEPDLRPSFGSFDSTPQTKPQFGGGYQSGPQFLTSFQDRSPYGGGFYNPPPIQNAFPISSPPAQVTNWSPDTVWIVYIIEPAPPVHQVVSEPSQITEPIFRNPPTSVSNSQPLRQTSNVITQPIITSVVHFNPAPDVTAPLYASLDTARDAIPSAANVLAITSSATEALAAASTAQLAVHEGSTAAILASTARDLVFKDYSANLLLLSTTSSIDRTNLAVVNPETSKTDGLDGLIVPHEQSMAADIARSTDAVQQEREAVNAVLEQLEDADSPEFTDSASGANAATAKSSNDDHEFTVRMLDLENVADEIPAGEIQAGMVLLPSTGDASESKFDLTPVYAAHVELIKAPGVETSVGVFQAIDVTADDATSMESVQHSDSALPPHSQVLLSEPPAPERADRSSRKATSIISTAALTGALIWMGRASIEREAADATPPKRHARRTVSR